MKSLIAAAAFALSSIAFFDAFAAADKGKDDEITTEQRKNMASLHEKMATCLRSNKAISECRNEMHEQCGKPLGENECPMMGPIMDHGKRHMRKMMKSMDGPDKTK